MKTWDITVITNYDGTETVQELRTYSEKEVTNICKEFKRVHDGRINYQIGHLPKTERDMCLKKSRGMSEDEYIRLALNFRQMYDYRRNNCDTRKAALIREKFRNAPIIQAGSLKIEIRPGK